LQPQPGSITLGRVPRPHFSHFANTRHENWTIIGVADRPDTDDVHTVEIYQGPDRDHPKLVLAPGEVPQFIAGLVATVVPGDLTARDDPDD
jgi:hypothetical protein